MDTNRLKTFAQRTRIDLMGQVARKLDAVLAPESDARREAPEAIRTLEGRIAALGRAGVVEQVAYTWFNRFTALRYMDVNGYLTPMVVSPAVDRTRPEILDQAAAGALPDHLRPAIATKVRDLIEGRAPSREPQVEAYRLLLVAACNDLSRVMPFLFEAIADYTELLMPNELLAADGWITRMREVMTEDACQDVEIIGWLYQFYISEKKDQVFAGLKKNQKITAENIPAATQLFTPHWIVRYLVENSLGRLWLLNRPGSKLAERMEYYIAPEEPETDILRISGPQEIRICDPACGSGHMLTYAFDLLYAIYEEEGVPPAEIPGLILTHNLTGIEIDDRAGALAAFALAMKAAAKLGRRRFLRMEVKPDIVVLENVEFTGQDRLGEFLRMIGQGSNMALADTLAQFGQAKNFGSLIVPKLKNPGEVLEAVRAKDFGGDIIWEGVRDRVVAVLRMAEALAPRYHVVVANPPYMGGGGMNGLLTDWLKDNYPSTKSDLFSAFIERLLGIIQDDGYTGIVTPFTWLYISSFKKLRHLVLTNSHVQSFVKPSYTAFYESAIVPLMALVLREGFRPDRKGKFFDLGYLGTGAQQPGLFREKIAQNDFVERSASQFLSFDGNEMAYNLPTGLVEHIESRTKLGEISDISEGLKTGENGRFIRFWQEVSSSRTGSFGDGRTWVPHAKGGDFRRWFGNLSWVVKWENNGAEMRSTGKAGFQGQPNYGNEGGVWSKISTSYFSVRYQPKGCIFDSACPGYFLREKLTAYQSVALLCSKVGQTFIKSLNPTMNFQVGNIAGMPLPDDLSWRQEIDAVAEAAIEIGKSDWDAYETSWDFTTLPLLSPDHRSGTLEATYARLRANWASMTAEMQRLEEENNRIFIDAYGLQEELTPEVPIEEITLTCNPAYRYGVKGTEEEREARLLADTMKELISYAIGCMFGRYSLDAPGLILANQGDTVQTYLDRIPEPSFAPDRDNVIPLLEEDWFGDDAYERFREFLSLTFGADRLVENLEFMKRALGKEVRTYLAKDFYADHVQRYKKRPIYWLVSSPKGAFQALIYMHRYSPDTLNITLNDYVRSLRDKLEAGLRAAKALEINPDASAAEKNRAKRDIDRLTKQIAEVTEWERDTLYPLAVERIRIDLDDGVKRNYPRFPGVLKPIKGLEDEDA